VIASVSLAVSPVAVNSSHAVDKTADIEFLGVQSTLRNFCFPTAMFATFAKYSIEFITQNELNCVAYFLSPNIVFDIMRKGHSIAIPSFF
jgi:hypothetical protein